jgi:hypothetical protein
LAELGRAVPDVGCRVVVHGEAEAQVLDCLRGGNRSEGDLAVDPGVEDVQLVVSGAAGVEALLGAAIVGLFSVTEDAVIAQEN